MTSGGNWRFGFAGDRCRVQVQTNCASERSYCSGSVDRSASRTVSRPLRVFVPSNAADDCIDSTRAGAFRLQVYKVGLHIAYDGANRHLIAGVAPRSGVGNPRNVSRCDCEGNGNEPLCGHASHNYVSGRQPPRGADGLYSRLSGRVCKSLECLGSNRSR